VSLYAIVHRTAAFDGGRFPCRAFLPLPYLPLVRGWAIDTDAARNRAYEQGWSQTPTGMDLCPSHTRAHRYEQQARAAATMTVQFAQVDPDVMRVLLGLDAGAPTEQEAPGA
jgi:hypothetical protein